MHSSVYIVSLFVLGMFLLISSRVFDHGSVVVMALYYKPECRGFETRLGE
jgi:hypothetical protein